MGKGIESGGPANDNKSKNANRVESIKTEDYFMRVARRILRELHTIVEDPQLTITEEDILKGIGSLLPKARGDTRHLEDTLATYLREPHIVADIGDRDKVLFYTATAIAYLKALQDRE